MSASGPPEDDAILRPRMGRRNRADQERAPSFPVRLARTAPRPARDGARAGRGRNQPGRIAVREPHALSRALRDQVEIRPDDGGGAKARRSTSRLP